MLEIQNKVKEFCEQNNLTGNAETRLLDTVSELGEVAKEILKSTSYGKQPFKKSEKLEEELGDLFFSLLTFANEVGVDLNEALQNVLEKYEARLKRGGAGSEFEEKKTNTH